MLWRERDLLDALVFKLEVQHLMAGIGDQRHLARATRELDDVLEQLRSIELVRALQVDHLATQIGLPPAPSLRVLAPAVLEPWSEIFHQHRVAFVVVTGAVNGLAERNRRALGQAREATSASLQCCADHADEAVAQFGAALRDAEDLPARRHPLLDEAM